jgi:hypothetical protein
MSNFHLQFITIPITNQYACFRVLELFRFKAQLPELSFIIERFSLFIHNLQYIIIVLTLILLLTL